VIGVMDVWSDPIPGKTRVCTYYHRDHFNAWTCPQKGLNVI